jgi:hypothetical protein
MGLPAFPCAQLLVFWGGVQHGFNGFHHNPVDYARSVRCPVLLMHGDRDVRVTREQAHAVFDNLDGAKRWQLFPEVGHQSYLAAKPALWQDTVSGFLADMCSVNTAHPLDDAETKTPEPSWGPIVEGFRIALHSKPAARTELVQAGTCGRTRSPDSWQSTFVNCCGGLISPLRAALPAPCRAPRGPGRRHCACE